jgi:hypothetical protein
MWTTPCQTISGHSYRSSEATRYPIPGMVLARLFFTLARTSRPGCSGCSSTTRTARAAPVKAMEPPPRYLAFSSPDLLRWRTSKMAVPVRWARSASGVVARRTLASLLVLIVSDK